MSNANTASFLVGNGGNGASAHFVFANLNGTISAWDTGATSFVQATTPGAVYTGLAVNSAQTRLYAANDAGAGGISVFNAGFAPVSLPGAFADPNLPAGLVPFNVQDIGGKVYVTYAPAGRTAQEAATAGTGVVDVYDENGNFLQRLITGSQLAAPWGIALAPAGFGVFGGDLLVGNFSYADSGIDAYDPGTGAFLGSIPIDAGSNSPGGLWALSFGNGGTGGSPNTLYVADGINSETGPDQGIWEARGAPRHYVSSKLMCWVALDRAAQLAEIRGEPTLGATWRATAEEIRADVVAHGVSARGALRQHYETDALDASSLLAGLYGFLAGDDEILRTTVRTIADELTEDGFVLRYVTDETDDGLSGKEGTFLICSFWLVSALTQIGELQRARDLMERLLRVASPLGLLAEELDVATGRHLGNFPQAFSHLALVNAAMRLIVHERLAEYG